VVPRRWLTSAAVKGVLARLFARHGRPAVIRSDNGSEFIAYELIERLESLGAGTFHIDSGKPWQNAFGESFHARLRDECLSCEEFWSLEHARVVLEGWKWEYNTVAAAFDYVARVLAVPLGAVAAMQVSAACSVDSNGLD
jgi:putative transposase